MGRPPADKLEKAQESRSAFPADPPHCWPPSGLEKRLFPEASGLQ